MMMILRKKNLSSSSSNFLCSSSSNFLCFLSRSATLLQFSSSSTKIPSPKSKFVTEYLISSCGFSLERARTLSHRISNLSSPDRPNSVRHFFKHQGFDDAQIRTIISRSPRILCANVDRSIGPNLSAIRDMGFTELELQKLILSNPPALLIRSAISRLEFWRSFLGVSTEKLTLAFRRNLGLVNCNIDRIIRPRIDLLKNYGLSDADIRKLVLRGQGLMLKSSSSMELLVKTVQELGFTIGSPMFLFALSCLSSLAPAKMEAKMKFYKSFGWSQQDLGSALLKHPVILLLSEENVRAKMEFLVERAGWTQKYVADRPTILGYSLERRLIPRLQAAEILKSKEMIKRDMGLYGLIILSENKFLEKFVLPYKDEVPMLLETYLAASGAKSQF